MEPEVKAAKTELVKKVDQTSVWPNSNWFWAYITKCGDNHAEARRRLGIRSIQTWNRYLMADRPVRMSTLENVAKRAGVTLRDVTCRPPHSRLIDLATQNPLERFAGTWHSVYLDFNRLVDEFEGKPHWWRETISFTVNQTADPEVGKARFRVTLTNAHGVGFKGVAYLLSEWQLVCVFGRDAHGGTDDDESIAITFTEKVSLPLPKDEAKDAAKDEAADEGIEVLVGSWPGTDRGNANARIYRNLLSRVLLTQEQIDQAAKRSLQVEKCTNCLVQ